MLSQTVRGALQSIASIGSLAQWPFLACSSQVGYSSVPEATYGSVGCPERVRVTLHEVSTSSNLPERNAGLGLRDRNKCPILILGPLELCSWEQSWVREHLSWVYIAHCVTTSLPDSYLCAH